MKAHIMLVGEHHTFHASGTILEVVEKPEEAQQAPLRVTAEAAEKLVKDGNAQWVAESEQTVAERQPVPEEKE